MKYLVFSFFVLSLWISSATLFAQETSAQTFNALPEIFADTLVKGEFEFEILFNHACTRAKSQDNTGTCWSYSTISMLESEAMRKNLPASDLSEMFMVRMTYPLKAEKYLRYHGKTNFSPGSLGHDVINIYKKYGAVPEDVYTGRAQGEEKHNHSKLQSDLELYLSKLVEKGTIPTDWQVGLDSILNFYLGEVPQTFDYQGKKYTSQSFAKEYIGIDPEDYISFTSFSHAPYYTKFILEIPDNFANGTYLNVPMNELYDIAVHAIREGYTFAWDCDVSEKGFSGRQGLAIVPNEKVIASVQNMTPLFSKPHEQLEITPELKQEEFDSYSLTDDHLMHIVGLAQDQHKHPYFFVKNSWGGALGFKGFLLASKAYFDLNTISILVHKDGVPEHIMEKFMKSEIPTF